VHASRAVLSHLTVLSLRQLLRKSELRRDFGIFVKTKMASFAVLGGGISGLSMAYYLTRLLPQCKVTCFEAKASPGGCISTHRDKSGFVLE
jgi:ribulose 1,5-bisphosphate synthetase/thiazole synthase